MNYLNPLLRVKEDDELALQKDIIELSNVEIKKEIAEERVASLSRSKSRLNKEVIKEEEEEEFDEDNIDETIAEFTTKITEQNKNNIIIPYREDDNLNPIVQPELQVTESKNLSRVRSKPKKKSYASEVDSDGGHSTMKPKTERILNIYEEAIEKL
jgi:hypothetical protein